MTVRTENTDALIHAHWGGGGGINHSNWVNNLVTACQFLGSVAPITARFFLGLQYFFVGAQQTTLPQNVTFSATNSPHYCNQCTYLTVKKKN